MNNYSSQVCGLVILYHPGESLLRNILSYQKQVDKLIVIDNSEKTKNDALLTTIKELNNVQYIDNKENKGVGYALNIGAEIGIKQGFDYLLTMDQDTSLDERAVTLLCEAINSEVEKTGIVSPIHFKEKGSPARRDVLFTMTSANLVDLKIYQRVGPFREDFFIDHIDHEYCLRLNENGFKVTEIGNVQINHELGKLKRGKLLFLLPFTFKSHSSVRLYYMIRNGLKIRQMYRKQFPQINGIITQLIAKELFKGIFLEPEPMLYLKFFFRAYNDYRRGVFGKLNES